MESARGPSTPKHNLSSSPTVRGRLISALGAPADNSQGPAARQVHSGQCKASAEIMSPVLEEAPAWGRSVE